MHLIVGIAVAIGTYIALDRLDSQPFLDDRRGDLYGVLVSVHVTMLGFALAALTILLGYAPLPRFRVLRDSPWFHALFRVFTAAIRAFTVASLVALVGILVDRDGHPVHALTALTAGSTITALTRLVHLLAVMERIVALLISDPHREAGT